MSLFKNRWNRIFWLATALLMALVAFYSGISCSTVKDSTTSTVDYVTLPIRVLTDEYYDFDKYDRIGVAIFQPIQGLVGVKVESESVVQVIGKFTDSKLKAKLFLMNGDAASEVFTPVEFEQSGSERRFNFIVPPVYTVPTYLNFRLLLYEYRGETDDDTGDDDSGDDDDSAIDDDTTADDDSAADDDTTSGKSGDRIKGITKDGIVADPYSGLKNKGFEAAADFRYLVTQGKPAL